MNLIDRCYHALRGPFAGIATPLRGVIDGLAPEFGGSLHDSATQSGRPYWLSIPLLAQTAWTKGRAGRKHTAVDEALWGQFCLFMAFRMQDDVYDEQAASPALVFAANHFLMEAQRAYQSVFPSDDPVWDTYRNAIAGTSAALLTATALQRSARFRPRALCDAYERIDGVLRIGIHATCAIHGRRGTAVLLDGVARHLAVALHIDDDITDIAEDAALGRWNYAARVALGDTGRGSDTGGSGRFELLARVGHALLTTDAHDRILRTALRRVAAAHRMALAGSVPGLAQLVHGYGQQLEHRRQVFLAERARHLGTNHAAS